MLKVRNCQDVPIKVTKNGRFFIVPNDRKVYELPDEFYSECLTIFQIVQYRLPPPPEEPKKILDDIKIPVNETSPISNKYVPILRPERQKYSGKKYVYYLTNSAGAKFDDITDIKQFCIDHDLPRTNIMRMAQLGNRKYSGWTGYRKTVECKRETNRGADKRDKEKKSHENAERNKSAT